MTDTLRVQLFFDDEHLLVPQIGDVINLNILIYPIPYDVNFDNSWLKSTDFGNRIKIVSIKNFGKNPNNTDAYEVNVLGVVTGKINSGEEIVTSIGPYSANAQFKTSRDYQQLVEMAKDFQVVETPWFSESYYKYITYSVVLVALVFVVIISRKMFVKMKDEKQVKIKKEQEKSQFIMLLRNARSRDEFENIYSSQKMMHEYFSAVPQRKEFLKIVDQYQYRKTWSDQELGRVIEYRDQLIKEFDRGI